MTLHQTVEQSKNNKGYTSPPVLAIITTT